MLTGLNQHGRRNTLQTCCGWKSFSGGVVALELEIGLYLCTVQGQNEETPPDVFVTLCRNKTLQKSPQSLIKALCTSS